MFHCNIHCSRGLQAFHPPRYPIRCLLKTEFPYVYAKRKDGGVGDVLEQDGNHLQCRSGTGRDLPRTACITPVAPQVAPRLCASERSRFPSWSKLGSASSSFAGRRFFCEVNPKQTTDKTDSKLLVLLLLQTTTGHKQVKAWM